MVPSTVAFILKLTSAKVSRVKKLAELSRFENVGMVGSAKPMCTSLGWFQAMAWCGLIVLYSSR